MLNSLRREKLREFVEKNGVVTLGQISGLLPDVSLMTIHRDLTYLQEQGLLQKIRGGARYIGAGANEPSFSAREIVNKRQKQLLSEKAVPLLEGVNSIFIDAGTTMMSFARLIPDTTMHIVTTGPNIALELAKKRHSTVELCGGALNKRNLTLSGTAAMEMISHINIDTAFLVASGYGEKCGFTCGKESEAAIKSLVIEKARRAIVLMDTSKVEKLLPYTFARLADIDCLVTEADPEALPEGLILLAGEKHVRLL